MKEGRQKNKSGTDPSCEIQDQIMLTVAGGAWKGVCGGFWAGDTLLLLCSGYMSVFTLPESTTYGLYTVLCAESSQRNSHERGFTSWHRRVKPMPAGPGLGEFEVVCSQVPGPSGRSGPSPMGLQAGRGRIAQPWSTGGWAPAVGAILEKGGWWNRDLRWGHPRGSSAPWRGVKTQ